MTAFELSVCGRLPAGKFSSIYVEVIAHKTTVYEHPRTMIYFDGPYDLRVIRDGERVIVTGARNPREVSL